MASPTLQLIGRPIRNVWRKIKERSPLFFQYGYSSAVAAFANPWATLKEKPNLLLRHGYPAFVLVFIVSTILTMDLGSTLAERTLLMALMFVVLPFLLNVVLQVGALPKWSAGRLIGGYVPEPTVLWISVGDIVRNIPPEWAAELRESDQFQFKSHAIPQFIEFTLKNLIENRQDDRFHGVVFDFKDENVFWLTLTSDEESSRFLAGSFFAPSADYDRPVQLHLQDRRTGTAPDIYVIKFVNWASRGIIQLNGLQIHRVEIASDFTGKVTIFNSIINEVIINENKND